MCALAREAPQHRIGHAGIARRPAVGLHQTDRKIDGGMVWHVEPEDLRRADKQRGFKPRRPRRELYPLTEEMAQGAQPAQHHGHQGTHQCAIANRKRCKIGLRRPFFEFVLKRPMPAQHAFEDLSSDPPRGKSGRIDGEIGTCHALTCMADMKPKQWSAGSPKKPMSPAAERALAEAAARRAERDRVAAQRPAESGRGHGLDPVRYGDWEVKGIASDF